jgi:hypothetical protein
MLAGMAESSSAAAHAQELLDLAAHERDAIVKPAKKGKSARAR